MNGPTLRSRHSPAPRTRSMSITTTTFGIARMLFVPDSFAKLMVEAAKSRNRNLSTRGQLQVRLHPPRPEEAPSGGLYGEQADSHSSRNRPEDPPSFVTSRDERGPLPVRQGSMPCASSCRRDCPLEVLHELRDCNSIEVEFDKEGLWGEQMQDIAHVFDSLPGWTRDSGPTAGTGHGGHLRSRHPAGTRLTRRTG